MSLSHPQDGITKALPRKPTYYARGIIFHRTSIGTPETSFIKRIEKEISDPRRTIRTENKWTLSTILRFLYRYFLQHVCTKPTTISIFPIFDKKYDAAFPATERLRFSCLLLAATLFANFPFRKHLVPPLW